MTIDWTPAVGAIWMALSAPFLARWVVAWSVWSRVHGFTFTANVEPRVAQADFPSPNRALPAFAIYVVANLVAISLALVLGSAIGQAAPPVAWSVLGYGSIAASVVWIFRRLRSDDRRWRILKAERIAARSGRVQ